jgi:hypothetical protein
MSSTPTAAAATTSTAATAATTTTTTTPTTSAPTSTTSNAVLPLNSITAVRSHFDALSLSVFKPLVSVDETVVAGRCHCHGELERAGA